MKIELGLIRDWCEDKKRQWCGDFVYENEPQTYKIEDTEIDKANTLRVLKSFYKMAYTNSEDDRSILLITNSGNLVEDNGIDQDNEGIWINGRDQCLGEDKDSWAFALGQIKTTSDFLAQLAVFCNKHAK